MNNNIKEVLEMLEITKNSISNKSVKRGGKLSAVVEDIRPDSLGYVIDEAIRVIKEGV